MSWTKSKLYYYPITKEIYSLLDLTKPTSGLPTMVKLLSQSSQSELTLTKSSEICLLTDCLNTNIRIYSEGSSGEIFSVPVKLQNKLQSELGEQVENITGLTFGLFKFFFNKDTISGDKYLSDYEGIHEDMEIIGAAGFSKPYTFKRFPKTYEWPHWGYNRNTVDAACFIPNKQVILYGITVYSAQEPDFKMNYKIYIDDNMVEENDLTISEYQDKYF